MKVAKKIVSFIMCLAIVAAMSVTAFAAPAEPQSAPIAEHIWLLCKLFPQLK